MILGSLKRVKVRIADKPPRTQRTPRFQLNEPMHWFKRLRFRVQPRLRPFGTIRTDFMMSSRWMSI